MSVASATVSGTLDTGSSGTVTAYINQLVFNNDPAALGGVNFLCPPGSTICNADVTTGTNLAFAGCPSGALGTGTTNPLPANPCLTVQEGIDVNSPVTAASAGQNNFMTFSNNPNLAFSLTGVTTFTNTNCAALTVTQSCVVFAGSPILLTLEPNNQTQVDFYISGNASDTGANGSGTPYAGFFQSPITKPLPNGAAPTPANIQLYFCGTNNVTNPATQCSTTASISSSQAGSFTATLTPEPSSMAMMVLGGALVALTARRRRSVR
jgi:hypothetical protein